MKTLERNRAVELRKQGKTYGEILKELPVSKGSLNYWLKDITLSETQLERIRYKNDKIKNNFIKFNELSKLESEKKKRKIFNYAEQEIRNISSRELKLIGIALYWAEGYKIHARHADFVNTDPAMIKLMMRWFREICGVEEGRFRIRIQLHDTPEEENAKIFWSNITGIPLVQFTKIYSKISPISKKKVGHLAPHGICAIRISDISLITRINGWISGLGLMALSSSLV